MKRQLAVSLHDVIPDPRYIVDYTKILQRLKGLGVSKVSIALIPAFEDEHHDFRRADHFPREMKDLTGIIESTLVFIHGWTHERTGVFATEFECGYRQAHTLLRNAEIVLANLGYHPNGIFAPPFWKLGNDAKEALIARRYKLIAFQNGFYYVSGKADIIAPAVFDSASFYYGYHAGETVGNSVTRTKVKNAENYGLVRLVICKDDLKRLNEGKFLPELIERYLKTGEFVTYGDVLSDLERVSAHRPPNYSCEIPLLGH